MQSRLTASVVIALCAGACTLQTTGLGPSGAQPVDASIADAAVEPDAAPGFTADAEVDASVAVDADAAIDVATEADAPSPCDEDNDGHRARGSVCGGDDCCDHDPNVKPGQQTYFATRSACGNFDYDCDGSEVEESSTADCKLGFFDCSGDGFAASTGCGITAIYTQCSYAGLGCNHDDSMRAQRCR